MRQKALVFYPMLNKSNFGMSRIIEIIRVQIQKFYEVNNTLELEPIKSTIDTFTIVSITLLSISLVIFTIGLPLLRSVAISERKFTFEQIKKLPDIFNEKPEIIKEKLKNNPNFGEYIRGATTYMDLWSRLNLYRHLSIVSFLISSISFISVILIYKLNFSLILIILYLVLLISILIRRIPFVSLESLQSFRFHVKIIFYVFIPIFLIPLIKLSALDESFSYIFYSLGIVCLFSGIAFLFIAIMSTIEANEEVMRREIKEFLGEHLMKDKKEGL